MILELERSGRSQEWCDQCDIHICFKLNLPGVISASGQVKSQAVFRVDLEDIKQEFTKIFKGEVFGCRG